MCLQLGYCLAFLATVNAQTHVWSPSPGYRQIRIWPARIPDAQPNQKPELAVTTRDNIVAGKPWTSVQNVSQPTITVYSPKGRNTGAAVVVFPGGGYQVLAIDLEGTEVCEWLASRGITGILLKYRVPHGGPYWDPKVKRHVLPKAPLALEDAQRAIRLVRLNSLKWRIDKHKIGVLGFSAGGHLAAAMSTHFDRATYLPVDAADRESCRPDFSVSLYPGHLWDWTPEENPNFDLNPDIAKGISSKTPPTFLLQAENDNVDNVNDSLVYYIALKNAKVPVEMHLYAEGKHAFGLRHTKYPITDWPKLVETWLHSIGMVRS